MQSKEYYTDLVHQYVRSWREQDIKTFSSCLTPDVMISECYGDVYENKNQAVKWFEEWHRQGHRVKQWEIKEMYYDESKTAVVAEWRFECRCDGTDYRFLGCSTIGFRNDAICNIKEYKMEFEKTYPYKDQ